jgi:chemotaxis protein CheX
MLTELTEGMIEQIVESVFTNMLGLEVYRCDALWGPDADRVTATVRLLGDWNETLLLECSHWQACHFAGRLLSADAPDTVDDDVRDALGELANIIGGNMKIGMARGLKMSMPSVTDDTDYGLRTRACEIESRLAFACVEGLFWVTLLATAGQHS